MICVCATFRYVTFWYSDTLKLWKYQMIEIIETFMNIIHIIETFMNIIYTILAHDCYCAVCVVVCTSFHCVTVFSMDSNETNKLIMMCLLCLCCRAQLLLLVCKSLYSLVCKVTLSFCIRILSVMFLECGVTYYSFSGILLLSVGTHARW